MSSRPQAPPEEVRLVRELAHGRWKAEVLRVVIDTGVPEHLTDRPVTAGALASAMDVPADPLRRVLDLAAALGIVDRDGDGYIANAVTAVLRADRPGPVRDDCRHLLADWARVAWANLDHALRTGTSGFEAATGTTVFEHLAAHPDEAAVFHARQASATAANGAALAATDLVTDRGTAVDVGGGTGTLLRLLLDGRPDLNGVVFDRADVVARAPGSASSDRLSWQAGDFFDPAAGELPPGADVYLLSHVLHDWADADAVRILQRVADAMGPDSRLLILENVLDEPNLLVLYLDVVMLTAFGSRERTVAGYAALCEKAGLRLVTDRVLIRPMGLRAMVAAGAG
jgi:hypothetical protein